LIAAELQPLLGMIFHKEYFNCVFRSKLGQGSGTKVGHPNGAKWATT
jgi:hypothetical protein